jgi:protein-disulfide isomerase
MSTLKLEVNSNDHRKGNVNATLTLIEYGDFQCPGCRRAHTLVKRLLNERGNDLQFVFRNFPLRQVHPHAYAAAIAAEAAGKQGKFWEMHDLTFENQDSLDENYLLSLAQEIGLDLTQFAIDRKSDALRNKIETDIESGISCGVNGTPTFFLNGNQILPSKGIYNSLLAAILAEANVKQH